MAQMTMVERTEIEDGLRRGWTIPEIAAYVKSPMCVPQEKIYNDAPDEFAEFLDSERTAVSRHELGGINNPFIKVGIYKPFDTDSLDEYWEDRIPFVCPKCNEESVYYFDDVDSDNRCTCTKCGHVFEITNDMYFFYEIDHMALAEYISKGIGCKICRQFKKT